MIQELREFMKVFFSKNFWTKKEISYQYVHFCNSCIISLAFLYLTGCYVFAFTGFVVGWTVEAYQWVHGNHKAYDMIRDLIFWLIGSIAGLLIYVK